MKWYLMGKGGNYYFWFRSPNKDDSGYVYKTTTENKPPVGDLGYYNLKSLMNLTNITDITPITGDK